MLPRLVHLAVGQLEDVPAEADWLSEDEREVLARLKLEKRRLEWRLGRWLARQAVRDALAGDPQPDLSEIAVLAAADGAPEVHGLSRPVSLSLSHRHGRGLAAAALGDAALGCDLELLEPRSDRFIRDWLTRGESGHIFGAPEPQQPLLANLCWSAKEAASKVLRVGLRFDTRSFEVELPAQEDLPGSERDSAWRPVAVTAVRSRVRFAGVWRLRESFVETVLAAETFEVREGAD